MENTEEIRDLLNQAVLAVNDEWLLIAEIDLRTEGYLVLHDKMQNFGVKLEGRGDYNSLNLQLAERIAEEYQAEWMDFSRLDHLREALRECSRIECDYVADAGENVWRRDLFQVLEREDGNPVRIAWFHIDIDRKKSEELKQQQLLEGAHMLSEQAYAIKDMYLERISKELQTPMNVIVGNAAVARAFSTNTERVEECLDQISVSAKAMFRKIRQVVKMDAIAEGNMVLHIQDISLSELWKTTLDMLLPALQLHHHELQIKDVCVEHDYVRGDAWMLRRIIINLLQNAINYTPSGGKLAVSVTETQADDSHGMYEFCLEDNGVGMSEAFCESMFEPFAREYSKRIGHVQGLGLGLVITRNLVRLMNGEIHVSSAIGKGTGVTVRIPFEYGAETEQEESPAEQEIQEDIPDYSGKHVLLVDSDASATVMEKQILTSVGMQVEYAINGEDAVRMFSGSAEGYYDLVVMDMGLPGIDGYAAIMGIRELNRADAKNIPVIVMTGYAYMDKLNLSEKDIKCHIKKPVSTQKLLKALRTAL